MRFSKEKNRYFIEKGFLAKISKLNCRKTRLIENFVMRKSAKVIKMKICVADYLIAETFLLLLSPTFTLSTLKYLNPSSIFKSIHILLRESAQKDGMIGENA
jgi:hypothetical protein